MEKSVEQIVKEKHDTVKELEAQILLATSLFQNLTTHYEDVYVANKSKNMNAQFIAGFASLLNSINGLQRTKNDIMNEINAIAEPEEQKKTDEIAGSKSEILQLCKDGTNG